VLLAAIAFGPSIAAPFDADDGPAISLNASIRQLWPPSIPLTPPGSGSAVSGRPVVNYSFALNYAINRAFGVVQSPRAGGYETISYHVVDIGLHVIAALLLFAVIWRTIRFGTVPDSWHDGARSLAAIVAGIWLIHPIQTDAVDYVSQRTEVLVSVLYLTTLYAAIRAWWGEGDRTSATTRPARIRWLALSVAASALGMATKEVMFTAPLVVLLFDRAFVSASWRAIWHDRVRRTFYLALFATMGVSLALIAHGARAETVGFNRAMPWYRYLYTQAWAVTQYLRLILWPGRLLYSYGRNPIRGLSGVPGAVLLVVLGAVSLIAWTRDRWRWAGFIGAFFFLILAPSSSVVPIVTEVGAERRAYLASAAVILAIVIGVEHVRGALVARSDSADARQRATTWALTGAIGLIYLAICAWTARQIAPAQPLVQLAARVAIGALCAGAAYGLIVARGARARATVIVAVACALLATAAVRSAMYAQPVRLWRDVVAKQPNDASAVIAVASAEMRSTPPDDGNADSLLRHATELDSTLVLARVYRATIAIKQQRLADAETLLVRAVRISPLDSAATDELGQLLSATNHEREAIPYLAKVAQAYPSVDTYKHLGVAYLMTGQLDSATVVLQRALRGDPSNSDVVEDLGEALIDAGRGADALPLFDRALQSDSSAVVLAMASVADAEVKQTDDAVRAASAALVRGQNEPMVMMLTGRAMDMTGRYPDAAKLFARAAQLAPNDPDALTRLAVVQAKMGNIGEATRVLNYVVSHAPSYGPARAALAKLGTAARGHE
jgi:tetratricopeptide (TPR) repeat protein